MKFTDKQKEEKLLQLLTEIQGMNQGEKTFEQKVIGFFWGFIFAMVVAGIMYAKIKGL